MNKDKDESIYLLLCSMYVSLLVCSNLICQKFFIWNPGGFHLFEISVGLLPYPFTFLVTDLISELYGKEKANRAVLGGLVGCFLTIVIILLADKTSSTGWSPVNDTTFHKVFKVYDVAVFASIIAAVVSQFLDVQIFHFFKKATQGKYLWLRNNVSTITSQLVDTLIVNVALSCAGILKWDVLLAVITSSFLFKIIIALFDTPFFYLGVFLYNYKQTDNFSYDSFLKPKNKEV